MGQNNSGLSYVAHRADADRCRAVLKEAKDLADFFTKLDNKSITLAEAETYHVKSCDEGALSYKVARETISVGPYGSVKALCTKVGDSTECRTNVVKLQNNCKRFATEVIILNKLKKTDVAVELVDSWVCPDSDYPYAIVLKRMDTDLFSFLQNKVIETDGLVGLKDGIENVVSLLDRILAIRKTMLEIGIVYMDWRMQNCMYTKSWQLIEFSRARSKLPSSNVIGDMTSFSLHFLYPLCLLIRGKLRKEMFNLLLNGSGDVYETSAMSADFAEIFGISTSAVDERNPDTFAKSVVEQIKTQIHNESIKHMVI